MFWQKKKKPEGSEPNFKGRFWPVPIRYGRTNPAAQNNSECDAVLKEIYKNSNEIMSPDLGKCEEIIGDDGQKQLVYTINGIQFIQIFVDR